MEIRIQKNVLDDVAGARQKEIQGLARAQGAGADRRQVKEGEGQIQLICPMPELVTAADQLKVKAVTSMSELLAAIGADAIAITEPRILKLFLDFSDVFEVQPIVVLGVPTAAYTPAFDQATWELDRVAYDTLIADLKATAIVDQIKDKEAGVRPPKPRRPGRDPAKMPASRFTDFDVAGADPRNEEDSDAPPAEEGH